MSSNRICPQPHRHPLAPHPSKHTAFHSTDPPYNYIITNSIADTRTSTLLTPDQGTVTSPNIITIYGSMGLPLTDLSRDEVRNQQSTAFGRAMESGTVPLSFMHSLTHPVVDLAFAFSPALLSPPSVFFTPLFIGFH